MDDYKFPIVTLAGSMSFTNYMHELACVLSANGFIVTMPHPVILLREEMGLGPEIAVKKMLENMQLQKIDMSNFLYVVSVYTYIGDSTREEINYALEKDKPVFIIDFPRVSVSVQMKGGQIRETTKYSTKLLLAPANYFNTFSYQVRKEIADQIYQTVRSK